MNLMKAIIIVAALLCGGAHAEGSPDRFQLYGQGLPLPWPFPWAKDCPVNWKNMEGRYGLSDNLEREEINLDITVVERMGFKVVRVARYHRDGRLVADGFTFVGDSQRTIRLLLKPKIRSQRAIWATIQLHYQGFELLCSEDNLVPILTLEISGSSGPSQTQYVLLKLTRH